MGVKGREVGRKRVDFISKTGEHICGTQLHWSFPDADVDGEAVESIFIRDDIPLPPPKPGQAIEVEYNRKGKVLSVSAIPGKQLNLGSAQ